ncbi:hypothetical protein RYX36_029451 [Vicia faba]
MDDNKETSPIPKQEEKGSRTRSSNREMEDNLQNHLLNGTSQTRTRNGYSRSNPLSLRKTNQPPQTSQNLRFFRKTPKLFELYKDRNGMLWCGLMHKAEGLIEEHKRVIEENEEEAANILP